ncbi:MAG: HAMP domain-containing sensor histidine kinase [Patescibacteria group bacterium]
MGPLGLTVIGFDFSDCDRNAWEGIGVYYGYFVEALLLLLIIVKTVVRLVYTKDNLERIKLSMVSLGICLLFIGFLVANFLATFTGDYVTSQYGHVAVPIFAAFLAYITIKYESFEPRILLIDTLVVALFILLSSLLFVDNASYQIYANIMAFIIMIPLGYTLVTGIRKEVRTRKQLQQLTGELEVTNERQEVLMHFIGHEVKGTLAKDSGVFAAISEGDLGPVPEAIKTFVDRALVESRVGASSVENILKASNLKKGSVTYTKEPFDLKELVAGVVEKVKVMAEQKGLALIFTAEEAGALYTINGDKAKLGDNVFRNLVENSINYTPTGSVAVSLKKENGKFIFAVKDTGIGITEEDKQRLFTEGGHGKDSQKVNAHSTGYGLFIAKQITEANGGTIRAESEGEGKGSTFTVEFPV